MGRLSKAAAALGAAAVLIAGGGAYALASSGGAITVCVSHNRGTLYKAKKCARHDEKLTWSKQGPKGATGATGPQGGQGPQGQRGPAGTARAYGVISSSGNVVAAKSMNLTASALTSLGPGVYCVKAAGVNPATVQAIATPDFDDAPGADQIVQTVDADMPDPGQCPGGWEFVTDTFNSTTHTWSRANIAISVIVP